MIAADEICVDTGCLINAYRPVAMRRCASWGTSGFPQCSEIRMPQDANKKRL